MSYLLSRAHTLDISTEAALPLLLDGVMDEHLSDQSVEYYLIRLRASATVTTTVASSSRRSATGRTPLRRCSSSSCGGRALTWTRYESKWGSSR